MPKLAYPLVLSSFIGIATIFLLSAVLNLLAKLNCFLQRKNADFSRLSIILDSALCELENLKKDGAEWCSQVELCISKLTNDHGTSIRNTPTHRGQTVPTTVNQYRDSVAALYILMVLSPILKVACLTIH